MSQLHNTFIYDPIFFGFPHNIVEDQPIEPFWHQYPEWVNPEQQVDSTSFYYQIIRYPSFNNATMEHENEPSTTYIGRNTVNGRLINKPTSPQQGKRPLTKNKPFLPVDVSTNGTFIQQMPLKVLTRFSKVAAAAFPRPPMSEKTANGKRNGAAGDDKEEKDEPTKWADYEVVNVKKLTAEVAKLNTNAVSKGNGTVKSSKRTLDLYLDTLYRQPPMEAFRFAFGWMHEAKLAEHGTPPLDYGVPYPDQLTLENLVDIYAAALVLGVRPPCHKHRFTLLSRITEQRPTLIGLKYVHEHLPINDVVMTRFITSYFEHREKHEYAPVELDAIEDYVCTEDVDLYNRFNEIGNARAENAIEWARVQRRRIAGKRMQRIAEGYQNGTVKAGDIEFVDAGGEEGEQGGNGPHSGGKKQQNGAKKLKGTNYARAT